MSTFVFISHVYNHDVLSIKYISENTIEVQFLSKINYMDK